MMSELEWRAIPGYEGLYEVSNDGQVMSLRRINPKGQVIGGFTLAPRIDRYGYAKANLHLNGRASNQSVHRLVMLAFVGPCPEGFEVLHSDGISLNNRLDNLSYGTRSDNVQDSVRHGTNVNAAKTHCKRGHAFTKANTLSKGGTWRECRKCIVLRREWYREGKAA